MASTYKPDDLCFYCAHTFDVHTEPGRYCATRKTNENGMPPLPGIGRPCTTFRKAGSCGECGARIAWHEGLRSYHHANPEYDENHQPFWRKSRVQ
jgi:hypothetical protein